jgi:hypothetical protein
MDTVTIYENTFHFRGQRGLHFVSLCGITVIAGAQVKQQQQKAWCEEIPFHVKLFKH